MEPVASVPYAHYANERQSLVGVQHGAMIWPISNAALPSPLSVEPLTDGSVLEQSTPRPERPRSLRSKLNLTNSEDEDPWDSVLQESGLVCRLDSSHCGVWLVNGDKLNKILF